MFWSYGHPRKANRCEPSLCDRSGTAHMKRKRFRQIRTEHIPDPMPYTWHSHKTDPDPARTAANWPTIKRTWRKESGTARVNIDDLERRSPTLRSRLQLFAVQQARSVFFFDFGTFWLGQSLQIQFSSDSFENMRVKIALKIRSEWALMIFDAIKKWTFQHFQHVST